ncbi:hypothetical protein [Streptomyces sp. x-80]|uniref:hypothetical protein n=1 Tax=Streptomyces sp. x-80 TaxID=2789282 RepID=UPI00397EA3DB
MGSVDVFVTGCLSALPAGESMAGRLERAVATGVFAVAFPGDRAGAPTGAGLETLGAQPGTVVR